MGKNEEKWKASVYKILLFELNVLNLCGMHYILFYITIESIITTSENIKHNIYCYNKIHYVHLYNMNSY